MQTEPNLEPDMQDEYDLTNARPATRFNARQVALTPEVIEGLEEVIRDAPNQERNAVKVLRKLLTGT